MRRIEIKDARLIEILNKKNALTLENQEILRQLKKVEDKGAELEKKFNTCLSKSKMIDEKSRPVIKKIADKVELGEYEEISKVTQVKNQWFIEIADRMEEFKAQFASLKEVDNTIKTCS